MNEKIDELLVVQKDLEKRIQTIEENDFDSVKNVAFVNVRKNFYYVVGIIYLY